MMKLPKYIIEEYVKAIKKYSIPFDIEFLGVHK